MLSTKLQPLIQRSQSTGSSATQSLRATCAVPVPATLARSLYLDAWPECHDRIAVCASARPRLRQHHECVHACQQIRCVAYGPIWSGFSADDLREGSIAASQLQAMGVKTGNT